MENAKILDIEIYAGKQVETGIDKYIEHFKTQGKDVEYLYKEIFGRNSRLRKNDIDENSLTMSIKATSSLLERNNLKGSDIDIIIFSSQTPEFLIPAISVAIHKKLSGKPSTLCFDMNANCTGMVIALDIICKYIAHSSRINKALLIGCDLLDLIADPDNEVTYGQYGDVACAVLLEKTNEECGLLGSYSCIDSDYDNKILFPTRGLVKTLDKYNPKDKYITWLPFDGTVSVKSSAENIKKVLKDYNLSLDDISLFCFSQFSIKNMECMSEELGINPNKALYIGDKYGYTATTSPFLALYEAINTDKIKRGDLIIFWGVGAGWQTDVILFKY